MSEVAAVGVAPAAGVAATTAAGEPLSIHVIWAVVLIGTVIVGAGAALFLKWLSRRRANRHALPDLTGEGAIHATSHPVPSSSCREDEGSPRKLQKVAWAAGTATGMGAAKSRVVSRASWSTSSSEDSESGYTLLARRHMSLPILRRFSKGTGRFSMPMRGFNLLGSRLSLISKRSSGVEGQQGNTAGGRQGHGHKRNASWIDEDALHGPATSRSNVNLGLCEDLVKDGGGLTRSPTLPMLRRSGQVGDGSGGGFGLYWEEVQLGKDMMVMTGAAGGGYPSSSDSYTQVVMEATNSNSAAGNTGTGTGRSLPEPPKPVVVAGAGRERQASTASLAVPASSPGTATRLGHRYSNSEPPMRPVSSGNGGNINTSPVRSLPRTPTRVRTRQPSTDSTLSEILRSTEKRLQEGYVSTSNSARLPRRSRTTAAALGKSQWYGTSRESLLDRSQYAGGGSGSVIEPGVTVHRSRSESKPYSQKRVTISTDFVGGSGHGHGHSRQESQTSTISSTSSIELSMINDFNSGLGDFALPSDADIQMLGLQSVRSSVSSALSTIQSEDEVPDRESVRMASSPLTSPNTSSRLGLTINSNNNNRRSKILQQNAPISAVDLFSNSPWANVPPLGAAAPRPLTINAYPTRSQKSPDLLRESLERSLRTSLLRAPVDQSTLLAQASSLPPLPAAPGGGKPHSFFRGDCPGCCKLGETKTIPVQTCGGSIPGSAAVELPSPSRGELVAPSGGIKGPLGPRSLSVSTGNPRTGILNSIVLPPPVAAPQFRGVNGNFGNDNSSPPPSPTHRPSSRASMSTSASKIHRMSSVSSSVYSQDARELPITTSSSSMVPMSTSVNSNKVTSGLPSISAAHLSAPAPLQTIFKGTRNSVENTKLPKFTGFVDVAQKGGGKRVLSLEHDSSENDQENININASTHTTDFAITSTVAELRRMNSALSMATSVASSDACGGGVSDSRPNTPTTVTSTSTARLTITGLGVVKGHKKNKSSSSDSARKAYLSLGGRTPTSSSNSSPQKRRSASGALTTTNSRSGSPALRDRSRNVSTTITITRASSASPTSVVVPGFVAALESATTSPAATSSGSPIKKKRRTVGGAVARMSPGPGSGLLGRKVSEAQQEKYRFEDSDSPDQVANSKAKPKEGGKKEDGGNTNTGNNNNDNHQPNDNNDKPTAATPTSAPGQRVSFKFPPVAVQATSFTFQVIPASSPLSSPSGSNPSTPKNNHNHNSNINTDINPTKRHRRHNSSHDSSFSRVQNSQQLQWDNPLAVARVRDRTPSPAKNSNIMSSLAGYTYSPPKTPTAAATTGETKRVFPMAVSGQDVPEISPLQIPMKSPRRQQQHRFVSEQRQQQGPQGQQQAIGSEEKMDTPTRTETQTQTPYAQKMQAQTPGTIGTGRRSVESLGLYDKDGFLISNSPVRFSPLRCR